MVFILRSFDRRDRVPEMAWYLAEERDGFCCENLSFVLSGDTKDETSLNFQTYRVVEMQCVDLSDKLHISFQ